MSIFAGLTAWMKGMINKMLGTDTIEKEFGVEPQVSTEMQDAIELWGNLYQGNPPWASREVKTLNLPAAIASEIARAATIEMNVTIEGSPRADYLQSQLDPFTDRIRGQVEIGVAYGGMVFKPYPEGTRIAIDAVRPDQFYPIRFDSQGNLEDAVFIDQVQKGKNWYTRMEYHRLTSQGVEIKNLAFKSSNQDLLGRPTDLAAIDAWKTLLPEATIKGIDRPLFAYFRYPQANTIDTASHLGASAYSRAAGLIEQADRQWSQLLWEFESGQRALYADVLAFTRDQDGNPVLPNQRLYRGLNSIANVGEGDLFKEWSPTFREQNILNALDAILKKIEFSCGLAYGTISDPAMTDKTATELKITKQRTYATIRDTQKALQNSLEQLIWVCDIYATLYSLAPRGKYEATFEFDDSVIVDRDAQFQQDLRLVQAGIMSPAEFRQRNLNESEEAAKKAILEAQSAGQSLFD